MPSTELRPWKNVEVDLQARRASRTSRGVRRTGESGFVSSGEFEGEKDCCPMMGSDHGHAKQGELWCGHPVCELVMLR